MIIYLQSSRRPHTFHNRERERASGERAGQLAISQARASQVCPGHPPPTNTRIQTYKVVGGRTHFTTERERASERASATSLRLGHLKCDRATAANQHKNPNLQSSRGPHTLHNREREGERASEQLGSSHQARASQVCPGHPPPTNTRIQTYNVVGGRTHFTTERERERASESEQVKLGSSHQALASQVCPGHRRQPTQSYTYKVVGGRTHLTTESERASKCNLAALISGFGISSVPGPPHPPANQHNHIPTK
jgi:hypothetical protein